MKMKANFNFIYKMNMNGIINANIVFINLNINAI